MKVRELLQLRIKTIDEDNYKLIAVVPIIPKSSRRSIIAVDCTLLEVHGGIVRPQFTI